jgi:hypothetical protein
LAINFDTSAETPRFNEAARSGTCPDQTGLVAYYSNRCPYSEYHVTESLVETARNRQLPLKTIKIATLEEARTCPSPASIFGLFLDGKFVITDISVCMHSRFDMVVGRVV